jgi:hypothetical protein
VTILPFWGKVREGKDASSDDGDVYGLHAYAKVDAYTFGGYGTYYNLNSYPLNTSNTTYGAHPAARAYAYYFGGYFDGTIGPVKFNTDFIYDTGKIEAAWNNVGVPSVAGADDEVDMDGWMAQASFVWPCDLFEFGGGVMYATGADANETSSTMLPGTTTGNGSFSRKMKGFVNPPGAEPGPDGMGFGSIIYGHPYLSREPAWGNQLADNNNFSAAGIGGSWNARLWGSYKVAPWYKVTLQAMYVGDTVENGNWLAQKFDPVSGELEDEDYIGFELTLTNMFQIYKNLSAGVVFGYLFAGDALTDWTNGKVDDDPWMIGTRMVYSF